MHAPATSRSFLHTEAMTGRRMMPKLRPIPQAIGLLAALTMAVPELQAAITEIAHEPLITQAEFKPKPNLMVILDDSGSMDRAYMPDEMNSTSRYGYKAAHCSGVAYDRDTIYTPPVDSDGTSYPNANFSAAWDDGFSSSSSTTDLGNPTSISASSNSNVSIGTGNKTFTISGSATYNFTVGRDVTASNSSSRNMTGTVAAWNSATRVLTINVTNSSGSGSRSSWTITSTAEGTGQTYYTYTGKEKALNWTYGSGGGLLTDNDFYKECMSSVGSKPGSNVFTAHTVTHTSTEATNYANWYSYYRTRRLLMRTAMGQAMNVLGDGYRVGFMQLNKQSLAQGDSQLSFRPSADFNASQKADFYASLYAATGSSATPSRTALSTVGQYFAKKLSNQKTDPMQYACQRNFALLTTDGYWNTTNKGLNLSGRAIGNADKNAARPMMDDFSDTLADVAYYYYETDLRTPELGNCTGAENKDVCANIVPPLDRDTAAHQHMTTFTIGMGVNGTLVYDKNYLSQTSGDYHDLKQGTKTWPQPPETSSGGDARNVDDLWHAAVNGRGQYYSAKNATALAEAIQGVVASVQETTGAGSATSTSVLDLVQGDGNIAFEASYTTGSWFGDVLARELDSRTAAIKPIDPKWSARVQLNAKQPANRKIYFSNGTTTLTEFTWATLPEGLQNHFKNLCSSPAKLSQCATLTETHKTMLNTGVDLVAYLRGEHAKETTNTAAPLFRKRDNRLGDIINSKPIHVGKPPFEYSDSGYAQFKASKTNRKKVIYVGANDGMLHALDAATGDELWAYIPTEVIPNLYKLADTKYGTADKEHQYYVDGKTVQGDVKIDGEWKTILVGGLNKGGRSYYALDITDPENPQALWEYKHDNLGLTYSDPIITKLKNGTWVVAFGSGYNNVTPGDGKGHLFVVNAATGALVVTQETTAGSTTTPSGLSKINAWVKSLTDNTVQRFYAGDMLGNVWRFVPEDQTSAPTLKKGVMLLAQMQDASGTPQPITTEPKLREYDGKAIVAISTGRYLGTTDITDTQTQSVATIRDPLSTETDATGWGVVRTNNKFAKITITKSGTTGSGSSTTVDWTTQAGWWTDLPTSGERIALAMEWDGPRLLAASIIPDGDQCKSGGASWLYSFNLANGTTHMQQYSADSLIVGFSVVRNDQGEPKIIVRNSANETTVKDGSGLGGGTTLQRARRVSWRELIR